LPAQALALKPVHVADLLRTGRAILVDIREADEFDVRRIKGAVSRPLSEFGSARIMGKPGQTVIFTCRSGMRTGMSIERLARVTDDVPFILEGGLEGWEAAGLPVQEDHRDTIALMRQVQVVTGLVIVASLVLGYEVAPVYGLLAALFAASMAVGGATGFCCVERVLAVMPWNRSVRV